MALGKVKRYCWPLIKLFLNLNKSILNKLLFKIILFHIFFHLSNFLKVRLEKLLSIVIATLILLSDSLHYLFSHNCHMLSIGIWRDIFGYPEESILINLLCMMFKKWPSLLTGINFTIIILVKVHIAAF